MSMWRASDQRLACAWKQPQMCALSCGWWQARDSARRKPLTGQEGLKHWGDPDVSNALAPAWLWYRSRPVNVIPNSSSLIMRPTWNWLLLGNAAKPWTGTCLQKWPGNESLIETQSNLREPFAGFHLGEWKQMWNMEFTRLLVHADHTQNTHQMLTYTHLITNEKHTVALTHVRHTLSLAFSPG